MHPRKTGWFLLCAGLPLMANSDKLRDVFLGMEKGELTFFKFIDRFVMDFEKKVDSGLRAYGTLGKYKSLLIHLRSFARSKFKSADISFNTIDCEFIQEFDYYLRNEQPKGNGIMKKKKSFAKYFFLFHPSGLIPFPFGSALPFPFICFLFFLFFSFGNNF